MKLHKYFFNRDCIGKGCCASIGENKDWVCYSDAEYDEKDELVQPEGHYRDVYIEGGLLAYCDGEYCKIAGYDETARTVTLKNDDYAENDGGRALSMRGDNAFEFTIPFEQFQADFSGFFEKEFDGVYDLSNIAEIVCCRCNSSVTKSENPEYLYQCFVCDEDLYGIEVEIRKPLIVEGTAEDVGFKGLKFTDEWCAHCENVSFNIPTNRVSLCAHCGEEIFPCGGCDETADGTCSWNSRDLRCRYFNHTEAWKMKERERGRMALKERLRSLEESRKVAEANKNLEVGNVRLKIDAVNEEIRELNALIADAFVRQCSNIRRSFGSVSRIWDNRTVIVLLDDKGENSLLSVHLIRGGNCNHSSDHYGVAFEGLRELIEHILTDCDGLHKCDSCHKAARAKNAA